jgi:sugar phosphate isomerase/epimerase
VVEAVANEGWDGIAFAPIALQFDPTLGTTEELAQRCAAAGLGLTIMVHAWQFDLAAHLDELAGLLRGVAPLGAHHVVAHGGYDSWGIGERSEYFGRVTQLAGELGLVVTHETHRHRPLFTPWATRDVLAEFPELPLTLDLSHWVNVAERLLTHEDDIIAAAAARTLHLDARIGFEEGPQVSDPSAPEWVEHAEWFTRQWQRIVDVAAAAGTAELVVVPEYGPPPYQTVVPHRRGPVGDLWAMCRAERDRLRAELRPPAR